MKTLSKWSGWVQWYTYDYNLLYGRYEAELAAAAAQPLPDDDDADFESWTLLTKLKYIAFEPWAYYLGNKCLFMGRELDLESKRGFSFCYGRLVEW